jgi:hypothetical protein
MVRKVWADYGPEFDPEHPENPNDNCFTLAVDAEDYDALAARLAEAEARADQDVIARNRVIAEKSARLAEAESDVRHWLNKLMDCEANLEALQKRWDARPVTDELQARLTLCEQEADDHTAIALENSALRNVIKEMHLADDAYGCAFYNDDRWIAAYRLSRAMVIGDEE